MKRLKRSGSSEIEKIKKEILERIKPGREDEERIKKAGKLILEKVESKAKKVDKRIEASILGSVSRNTWLKEENDIDIFLKFPLEYGKEDMEKAVFGIANAIFDKVEKKYAEHPYVKAGFDSYVVEIVPCYSIGSVKELKSAVDRTPFHDAFVRANIKGKEDEVRLLKQFLRGLGIYGAEEKIRGFSGYLCELLIIKYGSFENLIKHAVKWKKGEFLKIGRAEIGEEDARKIFFENPALIFIDPVDIRRNVAAALSEDNFYYFKFACMQFLKSPKPGFFFPEKRRVDESEIRRIKNIIKERGMKYIAIKFSKPVIVEEILYSQLRKAERIIKSYFETNNFDVIRAKHFACKSCYIILELSSAELSRYFLKSGPEIGMEKNVDRFMEKHRNAFLLKNRLATYSERRFKNAKELLKHVLSQKEKESTEELEKKGIPKYIAAEIKKGFKILENENILEEASKEADERALMEMADFIDPKFPWMREK